MLDKFQTEMYTKNAAIDHINYDNSCLIPPITQTNGQSLTDFWY